MNKFKVPKKQWKKWNEAEQELFNSLFEHMNSNQDLYKHPALGSSDSDKWNTTAWNAAWMAADFMRDWRKNNETL